MLADAFGQPDGAPGLGLGGAGHHEVALRVQLVRQQLLGQAQRQRLGLRLEAALAGLVRRPEVGRLQEDDWGPCEKAENGLALSVMNTDLLGYVLPKLRDRSVGLRELAGKTGVPYDTLKKIALGYTKNPGVQHVQRLADYFASVDEQRTAAPGAGVAERQAALPCRRQCGASPCDNEEMAAS